MSVPNRFEHGELPSFFQGNALYGGHHEALWRRAGGHLATIGRTAFGLMQQYSLPNTDPTSAQPALEVPTMVLAATAVLDEQVFEPGCYQYSD